MNKYKVINIIDLINVIGTNKLQAILNTFSCSKNYEIEYFLHNNAIDFANKKLSVTYLVFDMFGRFIAYFTLTHKTSIINGNLLSNTKQKKLSMYSKKDNNTNTFDVSAFLIAQFGKNSSITKEQSINGNKLMEYALATLKKAQHLVGGGIVFLECEENKKLMDFYQNKHNSFYIYGTRISKKENKKYIQLLKFF